LPGTTGEVALSDLATTTASPVLFRSALPVARLVVVRGARPDVEYPLRNGPNVLGRAAPPDVDVDLADQEPPEFVLASRRHAVVRVTAADVVSVEDLASLNGTFVNGAKIPPAVPTRVSPDDLIQIGAVLLRLVT
jgi:S-DNA-T family DNA segregation ATPase FtsK/SpoIIIE